MDVSDRVLDKLDKLDERLNNQEITLTQIQGDLKEHMSRTLAVEKTNDLLAKKIDIQEENFDKRIGKFERWYDRFHFLGWLISAAYTLLVLFKAIH